MSLLDSLIGFVAAHVCLGCGREGQLICTWCRPDIFPALPSKCYRCSAQTADFKVCSKCRPRTKLRHVWLRTYYDGPARLLVRKYKFGHARAAAKDLAEQMVQTLPYLADTVLVPIPTATSRVRQRGFDHTKLLARELSHLLKIQSQTSLRRLGQSQQVGTKRRQRIQQVAGNFEVTGDVSNRKILLVDDVVTTGATLEEAARVLKLAGAKQVDAAVFAQAK